MQSVTIEARLSDPAVTSMSIVIIWGKATGPTLNNGTIASLAPGRQNAVSVTQNCPFGDRPCTYTQKFDSGTLVTYQATATTAARKTIADEEVTFLVAPLSPMRLLRPIVWHSHRPEGSTINIGFFPNEDYTDDAYPSFTSDVAAIIKSVFWGTSPFAKSYADARERFNVWVGPTGAGVVAGCIRKFLGDATGMDQVLTGAVILHREAIGDCADVHLQGSGSVNGVSMGSDYLFVHESGHFLHALGDEYPGGGHWTGDKCRNLFQSKAECEDYGRNSALNGGQCGQISASNYWHLSGDGLEIMADVSGNKDGYWTLAARQCVEARLAKCQTVCYP